jgi:hypothetical protein
LGETKATATATVADDSIDETLPTAPAPHQGTISPTEVPATTTFETMTPPIEPPPRSYGPLMKAGVVLLGVTLVLAYKAETDAEDYSRGTGTVVEVVPSGSGTKPVIAYEVANRKYTIQGQESGVFVKAHSVGETVDVLYTPLHAEDGHLYCSEDEWLWVKVLGAASVALLASWAFLRRRAAAAARKW